MEAFICCSLSWVNFGFGVQRLHEGQIIWVLCGVPILGLLSDVTL